MGAGASVGTDIGVITPENGASQIENKALNRQQKEWLVRKIRAKYETGVAPEKVLEYAKTLPIPPRYVSEGDSKLLSVSILHRHGSRGPGASELRPWGENSESGIVSQWQKTEIENLTSTGHILIQSLGKFFSERFIMSEEDESNERLIPLDDPEDYVELKLERNVIAKSNVGRSIWRCSRSNRVFESGNDFNQAFCGTFNHPAQVAPIKDILPRNPTRYEDVEDENREDDHGVDHYFRPWNVYKKEMSAFKNGIVSNLEWVNKANNNLNFLRDLFTHLEVDESIRASAPKMLWCCTYVVCLYECERYWPTYVVKQGPEAGFGLGTGLGADTTAPDTDLQTAIAAKQAEMKRRERRKLTHLLNEMEEEYKANEEKRKFLRPAEEFPEGVDEAYDSIDQEVGMVMSRLHDLALWVWEQRFIKSPYATELGGRMAFDILQTTMNYPESGFNLFSGHDYTLLGVLSVLRLFPDGRIPGVVGFGAYLIFELWSDTPPPHASHYREKQASSASKFAVEHLQEGKKQEENLNEAKEMQGDEASVNNKENDLQKRLALLANNNNRKPSPEVPEDRRVLRILYNDQPFHHAEEAVVVEYMEAYADEMNPFKRDQYRRKWPVVEENEMVLGEWPMSKVARVMGDILEACKARNMKICLKGSPHEDYRWLL